MKKTAKRLSYLFCALCLCALLCALCLTACGRADPPAPVDTDPAGTTADTQPEETPAPDTDAPAEPETEPATESETETEPETETEYEPVGPFYVCRFTGDLENGVYSVEDRLDNAISTVRKKFFFGLRVCDSNGVLVWAPFTELQCDLLREGKWVADYVRENGFTYGDAPINPAMDCSAKLVSCDRLVEWIYYRVGFTEQPRSHGLTINNIFPWCESMGFEKITRVEDLQPGDIVGVRDNHGIPEHVFMFAGPARLSLEPKATANTFRYDGGSNYFIQSIQPISTTIDRFMVAYRPVRHSGSITQLSTGITDELTMSGAGAFWAQTVDDDWTDTPVSAKYDFEITLEGHVYRYESASGIILDTETGLTSRAAASWKQIMRDLKKAPPFNAK